jgi:hypothetical protein
MVSNTYKTVSLNIFMTTLVYVVATNAILSHFGMNIFNKVDSIIGYNVSQIVYLLTAISIIFLAIKKHTWLPFLGPTVIPTILMPETKNVGDTTIKIKVTPNTKVAYWSTLPSNEKKPDVDKAYGDYSNAGISKSDNNGFATLTFNKGTGYIVPSGKYIKPHIHYRELNTEYSMIGPVKTIPL